MRRNSVPGADQAQFELTCSTEITCHDALGAHQTPPTGFCKVMYHTRFSIELLRREGLLDEKGTLRGDLPKLYSSWRLNETWADWLPAGQCNVDPAIVVNRVPTTVACTRGVSESDMSAGRATCCFGWCWRWCQRLSLRRCRMAAGLTAASV